MVLQLDAASHPIVGVVAQMRAEIGAVREVNPTFMAARDQGTALVELVALRSQVDELLARVLGAADRSVAFTERFHGDGAAHLAHVTKCGRSEARALASLARELEAHPYVVEAMRDGSADRAQAAQICRSLGALPDDLSLEVASAAEAHLASLTGAFDAQELRVLGRRVLEVVCPDAAETEEAKVLEREESAARCATRLTMRSNGDGTTRIRGVIPDLVAARLANYLHAFTSPRRHTPEATEATVAADAADAHPSWWQLPHRNKLGEAFVELIERVDPRKFPQHGVETTHLIVTMPLESLRSDLAGATVLTPEGEARVSASEARRLACGAGVIPAVLGGGDEVLNLGRSRRLATKAQKRALMLAHPTCQAEGCDKPAAWTEIHHLDPWSHGGSTDLDRLALLCSRDHHRIHDRSIDHTVMPDGSVRFHRRP